MSDQIRILGQESKVVKPDGAGIPAEFARPSGIVVEVGGLIVSATRRRALGLDIDEVKPQGGGTTKANPPTSSRWDRVERPTSGVRLIG